MFETAQTQHSDRAPQCQNRQCIINLMYSYQKLNRDAQGLDATIS